MLVVGKHFSHTHMQGGAAPGGETNIEPMCVCPKLYSLFTNYTSRGSKNKFLKNENLKSITGITHFEKREEA